MIKIETKSTCENGENGFSIKSRFKETTTKEVICVIAHLITQIHKNVELKDNDLYTLIKYAVKEMEENNE